MEKQQFESPVEEQTKKMNDKMKREGVSLEIVNSDVFLGEFTVTTFKISVACRDFGAIDLESGFKRYPLELKEGLNTIQIEALNTGELFPNTGQFVFYDANEKLVTNQQWSLNSGYKAIVKIRKIEGLELEEKK